MSDFVVYDPETGRIYRTGCVSRSAMVAEQALSGEKVLQARGSDATDYVDTGTREVVAKHSMAPTVSTSTGQATVSNLPDPCEIVWNGQSAQATGGSATITFDEPGTYTLTLRADPQYLEQTLEVDIP